MQACPQNTITSNHCQEGHPLHGARSLMIPWMTYPQVTMVLCHSPVACQRNPTSKLHTRKSDSTVSCRKSMACQHTRRSDLTVSHHRSAAGCRIKQERMMLCHSPVAYQHDPTSKLHTRKSDSTVSCRKSTARQHTRRSFSTVSCLKSAWVAGSSKRSNQASFQTESQPASQKDAAIPIGAHQHHQQH